MNYNAERRKNDEAIIALGETESNAINMLGKSLVGLIMPSAFDGTVLTVKGSKDGITYKDIYNSSGIQFSISVAVNRHINISPANFYGSKHIKLVSNAGGGESAERTIEVILMGV